VNALGWQILRLIIYSLLIIILIYILHQFSRGVAYQEPYWSEDRLYYVQKYQVLDWQSFMPLMPGQAGDNIHGYIRLHSADGQELQQNYQLMLRDIEIIWQANCVWIRGSDPQFWCPD
jgi:hypothetical protein